MDKESPDIKQLKEPLLKTRNILHNKIAENNENEINGKEDDQQLTSFGRPVVSIKENFKISLYLGFISFGGPIAHIGMFKRILVEEKQYLSSKDFAQLFSICSFLPGPTSTQLLTSISTISTNSLLGGITNFLAFNLPGMIILIIIAMFFSSHLESSINNEYLNFSNNYTSNINNNITSSNYSHFFNSTYSSGVNHNIQEKTGTFYLGITQGAISLVLQAAVSLTNKQTKHKFKYYLMLILSAAVYYVFFDNKFIMIFIMIVCGSFNSVLKYLKIREEKYYDNNHEFDIEYTSIRKESIKEKKKRKEECLNKEIEEGENTVRKASILNKLSSTHLIFNMSDETESKSLIKRNSDINYNNIKKKNYDSDTENDEEHSKIKSNYKKSYTEGNNIEFNEKKDISNDHNINISNDNTHLNRKNLINDSDKDSASLLNKPIDIPYSGVFILLIFKGLYITLLILTIVFPENKTILVMEAFYRIGFMVFGGGHVVIPMLLFELSRLRLLNGNQVMLAFSLVSLLPGPMFNLSAYLGTLIGGVFTGLLSAICLFLPGLLLVFAILPYMNKIKQNSIVQSCLKGFSVSAIGFIYISAFLLWRESCYQHDNIVIGTANIAICFILLELYNINVLFVLIYAGVFSVISSFFN